VGMMDMALVGQKGRWAQDSRLVAALDVGVSKTVCALASVSGARADLLGAGVISSPAAASGKAADFGMCARAIRLAIDEAEACAGASVGEIVASYGGPGLETRLARGVVKAKAGVISARDVTAAVQATMEQTRDPGMRVLHTHLMGYRVDEGELCADPRGAEGKRLSAEMAIVWAPAAAIDALYACAQEAGTPISKIVPGAYAAGLAALDPEDRDGALVIDLGAGSVGLALFGAQGLEHCAALPGGGVRVTKAVASALQTNFAAAERAKVHYASDCALADPHETVDAPRLGADGRLEPARVFRRSIQEAVGARLAATFDAVAEALADAGYGAPAHVVLVGGGAHLSQAAEIATRRLSAPVVVGGVCTVPGLEAALSSAPFATAAGLLRWACETPASVAPALAPRRIQRKPGFAVPASAQKAWRWLQESF
jgi:cell division protein FtsA